MEYDDISTIFLDKKFTDANELCPDCSKEKFKKKTCSVKYNIKSMSKYLMFILDIDNQELIALSDNILNIFKEEILINNNNKDNKYSFISTIC